MLTLNPTFIGALCTKKVRNIPDKNTKMFLHEAFYVSTLIMLRMAEEPDADQGIL